MNDVELLTELNRIISYHANDLNNAQSEFTPRQTVAEIQGKLADVEFLDKPENVTLLGMVSILNGNKDVPCSKHK